MSSDSIIKKPTLISEYKETKKKKNDNTIRPSLIQIPEEKIESIKDLRQAYVIPFDLNVQYMFHLMFNMRIEDALLLAWCKYEVLLSNNDIVHSLRNQYVVPNVEVSSLVNKSRITVNKLATYVSNTSKQDHPVLSSVIDQINIVLPEADNDAMILDKCVPNYKLRDQITLGQFSNLIREIMPYLSMVYGFSRTTYDKQYTKFFEAIERKHGVTLTAHERKIVYDRTFRALMPIAMSTLATKGINRIEDITTLLMVMKASKIQVMAVDRGHDAVVVVNTVVATMVSDDVASLVPLGVYLGVMKLARRFHAMGFTDIQVEKEDLDIICAYCYAKVILKELSDGDKNNFMLNRKFGSVAGQAIIKLTEQVIVPELQKVKLTVKYNMLLIKQ